MVHPAINHSHVLICILTLAIGNVVLYYRTLSYGLVIDDIDWYRTHPPVTMSLWDYLYGASCISPRVDHAITLALHIITALLVYTVGGIYAALIWSVHPCTHQTAIWLTGRRYSLINILCITLYITHTVYLIIPVAVLIGCHYYRAIRIRISRAVPTGEYNPVAIIRCIWFSILKLSGFIRYSFRYPYHNTSPYLPCTQPVAERYLAIPLIILCIAISHTPYVLLLIPVFLFRTSQLMPMYSSIQSFYDYHRYYYPYLEKLVLIRSLYPEIKT